MSFSERTRQSRGILDLQEELQLAYLLPSYETYTRKLIAFFEESVFIDKLIERKQLNLFLHIYILEQLEKEIYKIEMAIKAESDELQRQRDMLAQMNQEKAALLDRILKFAKELNVLRNQLNFHLTSLGQSIEKIDLYLRLLKEDTEKRYKQLYQLVEKQFSTIYLDKTYQLPINKEDNEYLEVDLKNIINLIKEAKLERIAKRDQSIEVDHSRIIDRELRREYKQYISTKKEGELYNFEEKMSKFLISNSKLIGSMKNEVNDHISKISAHQESKILINRIRQNEFHYDNLLEAKKIWSKK